MEDIKDVLNIATSKMDSAIAHLESELKKVRAGKANPMMLESVMVDYYGTPTQINQVANVSTPDAKTLTVQPWEKTLLDDCATAIINSNLGLAPQNNGEMLIISIPMLTEERRHELVKKAKSEGEHAKVGIRNARKEGNDNVKKLKNDGLSEDMAKEGEDRIQKLTDNYIAKVESILSEKETDIMKV